MNKVRLIKRTDLTAGEQAVQAATQNTTAAIRESRKLTVTLKDWVATHQQLRPADARTAFAALFAQPEMQSVR